jgi:hypothetical protein
MEEDDAAQTFFFGYWGDATDSSWSNWREMRAVVDRIATDALSGRLAGRELWFATDNEVLERAFHKGYSSSDLLYGMVEDLWSLCVRGNFAGTRMIDLGVDGLSRGDIEFAPLALSLRSQIPLNLSPLERSPALRHWLTGWMGPDLRIASPLDWIYNAQNGGVYASNGGVYASNSSEIPWVWDLPPVPAFLHLRSWRWGVPNGWIRWSALYSSPRCLCRSGTGGSPRWLCRSGTGGSPRWYSHPRRLHPRVATVHARTLDRWSLPPYTQL